MIIMILIIFIIEIRNIKSILIHLTTIILLKNVNNSHIVIKIQEIYIEMNSYIKLNK